MEFQWPRSLFLLGLIPLIVAAYIWILRRRRKFAVRYSSLSLIREVIPRSSQLRRHLPFGLFLIGLTGLITALGRPTATVIVPSGKATVILAIDVSRSMCSTDIPPNRLKAAKAAVLSFIDRQDANTQIGIIAFSGFAAIVQPPTTDQNLLRQAVNNLVTARRTAIGSGILKSLDAIAEVNPNISPSTDVPGAQTPTAPVQKGQYVPDIIVILSDGASNTGPMPLDAAGQAADRGIRIYTIGYGTAAGSPMNCGDQPSDQYFGGGGFGGGGFGGGGFGGGGLGGRNRLALDEQTLKGIAEMTGGEYYTASSAAELHHVFEQLPTYLITRNEKLEISVGFAAIGMLFAGIAIVLSMAWHPFP